MHFQFEQEVGWPPDEVLSAQRDRPARVAAYLPHVARVEESARTESPEGVRTERIWWLDTDYLPAPLRAFAPADLLGFSEVITWGEGTASFRIAPLRHDDAVHVTGTLTFEAEDLDTLLCARGHLHLDLSRLPRLPDAVVGRAETIADLLLAAARPNFVRLCDALQALLDDEI